MLPSLPKLGKLHRMSCEQVMEVLDELNIGAFIADGEKKITRINYSAQALIGLREAEVLGKVCAEVFTGVPCMMRCPLRGDENGGSIDPELEMKFSNGKKHLITRLSIPVFQDAENPTGCLTFLQDHTPIADLLNRIQYEEKTMKIILDNLDVGVFTCDRSGCVTFFNKEAEKITGYDRKIVLGTDFRQFFPRKKGKAHFALERSISRGETVEIAETRIRSRNEEWIHISVMFLPLKNEKGVIVGGMATFRDLTVVHRLRQEITKNYTFQDLVGKSPAMRKLFKRASIVAKTDATVLIQGETGTGKDVLAHAIHAEGNRSKRPFVKVNCAAIPENLLESELFGYIKGAFTGAEKNKPGRFNEADGGTIFLDEIGDMPMPLQAKLLRVLEDREFYPLGSGKTQTVNVRIISATNQGLEKLMEKRLFRPDLYYRLNVFRIDLPPLRDRMDDLPLLIPGILKKLCAEHGFRYIGLCGEAMKILLNYHYPGNIRELENILEHALIVRGTNDVISPKHLPEYVLNRVRSESSVCVLKKRNPHSEGDDKEREKILAALRKHDGHRGNTAKELKIDRSTLWRKIQKYHLENSV